MNEVLIISQWVIFFYLVLARKRKQFSFRFCNSKAVLRGENLLLTLFLCKLCCTGPLFSESSLHSLRLPRQWGPFTSLRGAWGWKLLFLLLLLLLVTQLGQPPPPVGDYSQQLEDEYAGSSTAASSVGEQVMDKTVSTSTGLQCRLYLCTQPLFSKHFNR